MKRIGLMDCNNFFVSCERLFRPDLVGKPVAVLSSNDGCIVARSQEVKDLGIAMGVPYFQVKEMCKKHNITLFSSNFPLYRDVSSRVMYALKSEFELCEVYSVDEAFFEVETGTSEEKIARIRGKIMQKTGIPVSFGVSATKTIAKVASTYAKQGNGVCFMDSLKWKLIQSDISCGKIWGIGRKTAQALTKLGITNVGELLAHDISFFRSNFGVAGERLYLELSEKPSYHVGDIHATEHQSLSSTRSFHEAVHRREILESALGYHTAHLGEKLRTHGWKAGQLTILVAPSRFGDFAYQKYSASVNLLTPTHDTGTLLKVALTLLETIYDSNVPYKKAGVILSQIVPDEFVSSVLFKTEAQDQSAVYEISDKLNARFGSGTVRPGVVLNPEKWQESRKLKSPEYTTQWGEIARVKAI